MTDVATVCMSYQRAGRIRTHLAVRPLILCVTESEADAYAKAYPDNEIVAHPDDVKGFCPTRNWVFDRFGDVFVMDDDLTEMRRVYDPDQKPHMTAEEAYDAIQATAYVARQAGAKLWGFANYTMSYAYDVFQPFKTTGLVNGMSQGLFADSDMRLPNDPYLFGSDYFLAGLNAYKYRYIWVETRFGFYQVKTFRNEGGLSGFRTLERERLSVEFLQRQFGSDVVRLKGKGGGRPPSTSMARKQSAAGHPYEKSFHLPW